MMIYNITCIVENNLSTDFITWLSSEGACTFLSEGMLHSARLMEVTDPANPEGRGFALQLEAYATADELRGWEECAVPEILTGWRRDWSRYLVYFTTIMQPIDICSPA